MNIIFWIRILNNLDAIMICVPKDYSIIQFGNMGFNKRNFGHIRSPYYAILQTKGDAVILLAGDGQDPPELIGKLIEKWKTGLDVVLLKRKSSETNFFLESIKIFFYKIMNFLS